MVEDKDRPEGPAGSAGQRRHPPSTIELSATEVAREPQEGEPSQAAPAEPVAEPAVDHPAAPEPPVESVPETASDQPPPPPRPSRSWPAMLGAGLAGGLVVLLIAGAAWLTLRPERDEPSTALAARLAGLELQVRELSSRAPDPATGDLAARLAKVESALAAARPAADPALANRLAATEAATKSLADQVGALARRNDEFAAGLREARARADAATAQTAAAESRQAGAEQADIERLSARIAAVETTTKTIQEQLAKLPRAPTDRAARLAVAATALKGAVERGAPYGAELAAAKPLVADAKILAPLEPFAATGVPRQAELARELAALAPEMLRHAPAAARDGGYLDRLQAHAERLVRIRPTNETQGDDPASAIARMEAKVAQGDLAGAVAEAAKLPEPVRAPAQSWIVKAQARQAALAAAERLSADALAALAASGS